MRGQILPPSEMKSLYGSTTRRAVMFLLYEAGGIGLTSLTSTMSTEAGTSPPGNSRSCSAPSCGPRSDRSAGHAPPVQWPASCACAATDNYGCGTGIARHRDVSHKAGNRSTDCDGRYRGGQKLLYFHRMRPAM